MSYKIKLPKETEKDAGRKNVVQRGGSIKKLKPQLLVANVKPLEINGTRLSYRIRSIRIFVPKYRMDEIGFGRRLQKNNNDKYVFIHF